jgi:hypothetical protein
MQIVPAHCPHCGLIFPVNFGYVQSLTLNNVRVGCPSCKNYAQTVDGTFDFVGNAIRVRNAPPRTIAILEVLQSALAAAQKGEADSKVLAKIKKASPELAEEIQKATVSSGTPLLALLVTLMVGNCSMTTNTSLNWNQLIDQVWVYATKAAPYPNLGGPAETPKINRQQRRSQERQTKKQPQQPEPPPPKKPAR